MKKLHKRKIIKMIIMIRTLKLIQIIVIVIAIIKMPQRRVEALRKKYKKTDKINCLRSN